MTSQIEQKRERRRGSEGAVSGFEEVDKPVQAVKVAGGDERVKDTIRDLQSAVAAEGQSFYNYLILSKIVAGINFKELADYFEETAEHEKEHIKIFSERVTQLGGRPPANPTEWEKISYAEYHDPPEEDTNAVTMLQGTLDGERAAIEFYDNLAKKSKEGGDLVTYRLALDALEEEVEDEDEQTRFLAGYKRYSLK